MCWTSKHVPGQRTAHKIQVVCGLKGKALEVFNEYDPAKAHIQVPEGRLRDFPDKGVAKTADYLRLTLLKQQSVLRIRAEGTHLFRRLIHPCKQGPKASGMGHPGNTVGNGPANLSNQ